MTTINVIFYYFIIVKNVIVLKVLSLFGHDERERLGRPGRWGVWVGLG